MREVFNNWNTDSLKVFYFMQMIQQHLVLKNRFAEVKGKDEMEKWLKTCTNADYYAGLSEILHLALSCFVKSQ